MIDDCKGSAFCETVSLKNLNAECCEILKNLGIDRCSTADDKAHSSAECVDDFLKDCDQETREEYGRIWDNQKAVPVGILFNRPNWEGKK